MGTPRAPLTLVASFLVLIYAGSSAADSRSSPPALLSAQQLYCEGFHEGTFSDPFSGFTAVNETLSIAIGGPSSPTDKFLQCKDGPGGSFVVCSGHFTGDYTALPNCTGLSFDARLFDDGQSGHLLLHPWVRLNSGSLSAIFSASDAQSLTENGGSRPGWHQVSVPYGTLRDGTLTNDLGTWTISSGVASDGAVILANVTRTDLSGFDLGGGPDEVGGYDNVCGTACLSPCWQEEAILQGPLSQTLVYGQDVHFSITTGSDVTSVQWVRLDPTPTDLVDGDDYSGTTTNELTVFSSYCAVGLYACRITTPCGVVQTATASLDCTDLPQILQQPADKTAIIGTNATFTIGVPPLVPACAGYTYHWYDATHHVSLIDNPPHITGTSTSVLHINQVGGADIGDYGCTIDNLCGAVATRNAHLEVTTGPGTVPALGNWALVLALGGLVLCGAMVIARRGASVS